MNRTIFRIGLPLATAILIAGCGGGGGGGAVVAPVGGSASGSASGSETATLDAFLAYVKALVATKLDTAEPADVAVFDPPTTTQTKEPVATP